MKKILSIVGIIIAILIGKGIGHVIGKGVPESSNISNQSTQKESLKRFLNEFIVHNPNTIYPMKVDDNITLTSQSIAEESGVLFVIQNLKLNSPKESLVLPIKEFKEILQHEIKSSFCSSIESKEYLFKGYSTVGLIQNIVDSNDRVIVQIKQDKSDCE